MKVSFVIEGECEVEEDILPEFMKMSAHVFLAEALWSSLSLSFEEYAQPTIIYSEEDPNGQHD